MGPPFNEVLYAQSGRKLDVKLEVPTADEECPLTLSPMVDDALECLQPTTTYLTAFPDVKKMVLPCGHSFGALNILYHFLRRNMLCPCCRAGINSRLSSRSVPSSFSKTLLAKVQGELQADSEEQIESDHRAASSLVSTDDSPLIYVIDLRFISHEIIAPPSFSVSVRFVGYNEQRPPVSHFNMPLLYTLSGSHDDNRFTFRVPSGTGRTYLDMQLNDPSVCALELEIVRERTRQSAFLNQRPQQEVVARSSTIVIDRTQNREVHTVSAEGDSSFYLELHRGGTRVHKLEWSAPRSFVELLNR
jgi:hypothetical protein